MTAARSPTSSATFSNSASFSSRSSVGDSPVVPHTTSPSEPWSTRCAARRRAPLRLTELSRSKGVTMAVTTSPNLAAAIDLPPPGALVAAKLPLHGRLEADPPGPGRVELVVDGHRVGRFALRPGNPQPERDRRHLPLRQRCEPVDDAVRGHRGGPRRDRQHGGAPPSPRRRDERRGQALCGGGAHEGERYRPPPDVPRAPVRDLEPRGVPGAGGWG